MMLTFLTFELLHFGYDDTPEDRQYPCLEKQMEYEIYKNGSTTDGAYKTDSCKRDGRANHHHHHHHHHHPGEKPCMYKEQVGTCTVLSIEYNNSQDDGLDIYVDFKPKAAKQKPADQK